VAIDQDLRERAEELYVYGGLTLEGVSKRTGVSDRTIASWSSEREWRRLREDHVERKRALKRKLDELREKSLDSAIESGDPQAILAAYKLEELAEKRRRLSEDGGQVADVDRPRIFLEDMEFIAEVLKEIDPEGLKVFARNFEPIVTRYKEKDQTG